MACGAYHSLVVLGEASKVFKKVRLLNIEAESYRKV